MEKAPVRAIPYGPKGLLGSAPVSILVIEDPLNGVLVYVTQGREGGISISAIEA
jgi:hypothetical protein